MKKTVLITGASRGLGLEFARNFSQNGYKVIATCRRANKAKELHAIQGDIRIKELNITAENQLRDLKDELSKVPIDILILNAGVYGQADIKIGNVDIDDIVETFKINSIYPLKVVESLFNNILASHDKKIIVMSSITGSIADNQSGGLYPYRGSKAALNAIMRSVAIDQEKNGIKVLLFHPGWVKTDMGGANAHIDASESVTGMVKIIESNFKTGEFLDYKGNIVPW